MDVMTARRNASSTIKALQKCRNESNFELLWEKAELLSKNMKVWIADTEFSFKDAKIPRKKPSKRLQAMLGETSSTPTDTAEPDSPESHRKVNTYYSSLDKVLLELQTRFSSNDQEVLCSLGDIALQEKPSERSFDTVSTFYKLDRDLLEADWHFQERQSR